MTEPLTREEAARTLGLTAGSQATDVKSAYRRLARQHHPDLGGDPDTFQRLQRAYERLASDDGPVVPVVSRGRPSRPPVPFTDETERRDLDGIAWETELPPAGRIRLDADRVAVWLAAGDETGEEAGEDVLGDGEVPGPGVEDPPTIPLVTSLVATSRAPGSRLNGVAHLLATELTAELRVSDTVDDRGRPLVGVEVTAGSRRARRALDGVRLDGGWVRTRGSSWTRLRAVLPPSRDRRATALRVTERLSGLLDELGWPLGSWTLERPAAPDPRDP